MWNSLRIRLTAVLIGLALGPFLVAGAIVAQQTYAAVRDQALALQVQVSQNASLEVENFLQNVAGDLGSLGDEIRSLDTPDRAQHLSLMLNAINSGPYQNAYDELILLDDKGQETIRVSRDEIVPTDELVDRSATEEFRQPIASRGIYYSPVKSDPSTGSAFFSAAIPLYEPRSVQLVGVLVVNLRFSAIADVIAQVPAGPGQTLYMTDDRGELVAHQDRTLILREQFIRLPDEADISTGLAGTSVVRGVHEIRLGDQVFYMVAEKSASEALSLSTTTLRTLGLISLVALALAAILGILSVRQIVRPVENLASTAKLIAAGDLSREAVVERRDEIGTLATTFNGMTSQLRTLIGQLEERVRERTQQLERRSIAFETVAQVARDIASVRNLDTLLNLAARLIRERFGYYHVGIFIVDERGEYAVLRAASSVAARTMLEQHHRLRVGEVGIVGYVANTGLARIALDVGADAVHFKNPLLPETRSEIGLPLRSQMRTIGVLNIQAVEASAFDQENIETLQLLADQLVSAIENAQLVYRSETTLNELNATYRSQTRQAWQRTIQERSYTALEYDGLQIRPVPHDLPFDVMRQLEGRKAVIVDRAIPSNNGQSNQGANTLLVPLMVLNQLIGVIGLEQDDPNHTWTPEEIDIAEATAGRAAIALENARLLQDAQTRAARERTIGDIAAKIGNLVDLDNIVQTTIQELGRNMPDAQVVIQFHAQDERSQG